MSVLSNGECSNANQQVIKQVKLRNKANKIIEKYHKGQVRKDGEKFVNHPIRVSEIISSCDKKHSTYLAGLLHDTIEDTNYTKQALLADFGEDVHKIVMECTEDKSKTWLERKKHTIEQLDKISLEGLVVIIADKIDNLESLARTIKQENITIEELFDIKFNANFENQKWYYSEIYLKALKILFNTKILKNEDTSFNLSGKFSPLLMGRYKDAIYNVFNLFSGYDYLNDITEVNEDNYIPILLNRGVDQDTKIYQLQFEKSLNIDGKDYYYLLEAWYWDHVWGQSAIFISKQFEDVDDDNEKLKIIYKCLNFKDSTKLEKHMLKDNGYFTFFSYGSFVSEDY